MADEEVNYSEDEIEEVVLFISKVVSITTTHYERLKNEQEKLLILIQTRPMKQ